MQNVLSDEGDHSMMTALHFLHTWSQRRLMRSRGFFNILPKSLMRGSTFVVKLLYEAIFPSGEPMPTWASYILRLVGFLGRGWTCWIQKKNDRVWHFFLQKLLKIKYICWVIMTHNHNVLHNRRRICFIHIYNPGATHQAWWTHHFKCMIELLINKTNILPIRGPL